MNKKLKEAIRAGTRRDYAKAVRILEGLTASWDAPPEAYLYLGRSFHALGDYSGALTAYGEFIRLRPQSALGGFFAGRSYLALGMPQQAIPLLEDSLERRPADASTLALLGTAYLKARRSQAAVNILQQAVESGGVSGGSLRPAEQKRVYRAYLNALFIRGIKLCHNEDYDLGMRMLGFVLENGRDEFKNIPLLRLELGRACRETGRLPEAAAHYTEALNYTPGDTRIRWYRASILMALGRGEEALEDLEIIRSIGGDTGEIPENLPWNGEMVDRFMIRSFLDRGEWRQAANAARTWLKTRQADPAIHAMYAEAQRNLQNYESALNHLNRAVELDGGKIQLWYAMLMTSREAEDWKTLKRALRKVKELSGDPEIIRRFTVLWEIKTGLPGGDTTAAQDRQAVELLQKAIRTLGPEEDIMYLLGERCLKMGLLESAIIWFEKTARVNPGHEKSYLGIIAAWEGIVRDTAGSIQTAATGPAGIRTESAGRSAGPEKELLAAYDRYLGLWGDNRGIRRERVLLLVHGKDFKRAAAELEILLPWEPENPTLRRLLAYCYRKTGRYREAAFYLKGLLKKKPEDTELLLEYSGCLVRAGAAAYAVMVLEKARELFSNLPFEVILSLGNLLYKEKKIERAFDIFREAAAKSPKDPRPYQRMAAAARELGDTEGARRYSREAKTRGG
jgi:tetratricopeptide (TPR) repeat protein